MRFLRTLSLLFLSLSISFGAIDKGVVKFKKGKAFISRGMQNLPANLGTILKAGDIIDVAKNSQVSIELNGTGLLKISERTRFQIPRAEEAKEKTSKVTLFFGGLWVKAQKLLKGESFEIKTPTATAGVRGTEFGTGFEPSSDEAMEQLASMESDDAVFEAINGSTEVDVSEGEVEAVDDSGNSFAVTAGFSFAGSSGGAQVKFDPVKVAQRQVRADATPEDNSEGAKRKAARAQAAAQEKLQAARKRAANQAARRAAEAKRKAAQEQRRKEKAEAAKKAAEARKKAAEAKKKAEAQRKKKEAEAKKKAAEAKKKAEAEAKKKAAEERKKKAEARKKAAESAKKRAAAKEAAEKRKAEAQAKKRAEAVAKAKAAQEAKAKAAAAKEAAAKARAETNAKARAEAAAAKEAAAKEAATKEAAAKEAAAKEAAAKEAAAKEAAAKEAAAKEAATQEAAAKEAAAKEAAAQEAAAKEAATQEAAAKEAAAKEAATQEAASAEAEQKPAAAQETAATEELQAQEQAIDIFELQQQNIAIAVEEIGGIINRIQAIKAQSAEVGGQIDSVLNDSSLSAQQKLEQIDNLNQLNAQLNQELQSNLASLDSAQGQEQLQAFISGNEELSGAINDALSTQLGAISADSKINELERQVVDSQILNLTSKASLTPEEEALLQELITQKEALLQQDQQNQDQLNNIGSQNEDLQQQAEEQAEALRQTQIAETLETIEVDLAQKRNQLQNLQSQATEIRQNSSLSFNDKASQLQQIQGIISQIAQEVEADAQQFANLNPSDEQIEQLTGSITTVSDLANTAASLTNTDNLDNPEAEAELQRQTLISAINTAKANIETRQQRAAEIAASSRAEQRALNEEEKALFAQIQEAVRIEKEKAAVARQRLIDDNLLTEGDATFSTIESTISLINDLELAINQLITVGVEIDFESLFNQPAPAAQAKNRVVLPIKFRNKRYDISIDRRDITNHKRVMQIIEKELQIQLNEQDHQDELYRLQQLKRLQDEKVRQKREGDLQPATATRDGNGLLLPIIIR